MYELRQIVSQISWLQAFGKPKCGPVANLAKPRVAAMIRSLFRTEAVQAVAVTGLLFAAVAFAAGFLHLVA